MAEQIGDDRSDTLPEGTDTVIEGASSTGDAGGAASTGAASTTLEHTASPRSTTGGTQSAGGGIADRLRSGREQFASQAGDRARGLVTQGLERTSEALANVSKMVGDTASGIEERLGPEYGDYARRAAGAIETSRTRLPKRIPTS